jgi:ribose 5-phosphate isomerase RpiB
MTFGYFGNQTSPVRHEELAFDVFDELDVLENQSIEFFDFYIDVEVNSGIGVPFKVLVENMNFYLENDQPYGDPLTIGENPYLDLTLESAIYGDPIEPAFTSVNINRGNSNIVDIGNSYPRRMEFDVFSESNPAQSSQTFNFMGPDNVLNGTMNVVLPAWFRTSSYSRRDTVDFDFNDIVGEDNEDARELEKFTVYFDFFSKIPVDIAASAYVIDGNGIKIDDLLQASTSVVAAGVPDDETGKVTEAKQTTFTITVSGDQIGQFLDQNAMNIVLETTFDTGGDEGEYIRIFDDMSFNAVVSFEASGKIPSF